jgi:hypothetical protein
VIREWEQGSLQITHTKREYKRLRKIDLFNLNNFLVYIIYLYAKKGGFIS